MALLNLTKLGDRTVDALQTGFQQQAECAGAAAFLQCFPTAVELGNVPFQACLFLFEPGAGALLNRD